MKIRLRMVTNARGETTAYRKVDRGRRWIRVGTDFAKALVERGVAEVSQHFVGERHPWPRPEA
jgi:hypothetical protein